MPAGDTPTFSLERFAWDAPDRLELTGVFSGMDDIRAGEPVLAVQGPDGTRRLPAIPQGGESPAANGGRWSAAFAWL